MQPDTQQIEYLLGLRFAKRHRRRRDDFHPDRYASLCVIVGFVVLDERGEDQRVRVLASPIRFRRLFGGPGPELHIRYEIGVIEGG